ncbi:MAG: chloroperoxidase [Vicinamibacteraceae bacterium]
MAAHGLRVGALRTWALVLTGIATVGVAGGVAATQTPSFDAWWGRDAASTAAARVRVETATTTTPSPLPANTLDRLHYWSHVAIDSSGLDHAPAGVGDPHTFGHHLGPGRASRAMAIVRIAMFEVVNAIDRRYESYLRAPVVGPAASMDAALAQTAHDTLVSLYPSQKAHCDQLLAADLAQMPNGNAKQAGILLGKLVAAAILSKVRDDGSNHAEPLYGVGYIAGTGAGEWRQDPISLLPPALGAKWGSVRPFVLPSGKAFRAPAPPPLWSPAYAAAYNEVKKLGGDGIVTPTLRTPNQALIGLYWAYDGTPSLCAPPRLYNQLLEVIATEMRSDVVDQARLFALANVAMSDAGIAIWESKYFYKLWRPVTAIREADPGTGPSGVGSSMA